MRNAVLVAVASVIAVLLLAAASAQEPPEQSPDYVAGYAAGYERGRTDWGVRCEERQPSIGWYKDQNRQLVAQNVDLERACRRFLPTDTPEPTETPEPTPSPEATATPESPTSTSSARATASRFAPLVAPTVAARWEHYPSKTIAPDQRCASCHAPGTLPVR